MAKPFSYALFYFSLFLYISGTHPLQSSHTQVLLQLQKHLQYPKALDAWNSKFDLCYTPSSPALSIACQGNSVTELRIVGDKPVKASDFQGSPLPGQTLSQDFSIDSFVTTLSRLSDLKVVCLVSLGMWGPLPDKIHRLYSLEVLDLSSNFLYGSIPPKISAMTKLQTLTLDSNFFIETVPVWFDSLSNLTYLSLKNNQLTGSLPNSVGRVKNLTILALSHNNISGGLPDLSGLTNLAVLDLRENELGSELPVLPRNLVTVLLSRNSLSGEIPRQLSELDQLQHLSPARHLSWFYMNACKLWSQERKVSAARSILSGLVFVAKASGADVPRLTFWLSNTVVLRAIISLETGDLANAGAVDSCIKPTKTNTSQKLSPSKWKDSIHRGSKKRYSSLECFNEWGHPHTFTAALEKIEAWIFSRVVKFLWWKTLAPHMQSADGNEKLKNMGLHSKKYNGRKSSLGNQEQCTLSINIWKKAIREAFEVICPVRAAGHDCGCLPVLGKLIMEDCVSLLDMAMFNAILRESDKDFPTDPLSDPISNINVLPVPVGKTSFGSGALLKNAIGDWSRLLTDLFGIDADDTPRQTEEDNREDAWRGFKPFHLLNALSGLLMLPKSLLFDRSIWKEVCPTFGAPLLKRILHTFDPDEFCPDPIPKSLLDLLDSQESLEANKGLIRKFPCDAVPINYTPPSAASINGAIGNIGSKSKLKRSGSLLVCKGQASDDELEELESLLSSIIIDSKQSSRSVVKDANRGKSARFGLLHEVWRSGD